MPPKIKILINHINVIDDLESMPLNLYKGFNPITKVSPHGYTWSPPPTPTLTFLQSPLNPKHILKSKQEGFTIKAINTNRQDSPQPFILLSNFVYYIYIYQIWEILHLEFSGAPTRIVATIITCNHKGIDLEDNQDRLH